MEKTQDNKYPVNRKVREAIRMSFGDAVYFPDSQELVIKESHSILPPKPAKVLEFLIANSGTQVSRKEIIKAVWPNPSCVTDENFYQTIRRLRKLLGDTSEPRQYVVNSRTNFYMLKPVVTSTSVEI